MIYALLLADILMLGSFLWRYPHLPPQIPLLYSMPWGEDQLADYWFIFILPFLMHVFIFLNVYIYNRFFLPDQVIRRVIDMINWFLIIAFTAIFLRVIFLIS